MPLGIFLTQILRDIRSQKMRTALTVFGILWGTASVILLLAFGRGIHVSQQKAMRGLGEYIIIMWPGRTSKIYQGLARNRVIRFREIDAALLKANVQLIGDCSPEYQRSDVKAKVDLYRLKKEHKEKEPDTYIDNHSPDKDARPGRKHKNKQFYGYKAHAVVDAESEIILNVSATPGNTGDGEELTSLSAPLETPKVMTADKAYDSKENHEYLSKNHIRNGIIIRKNHTKEYIKKHIRRVSNIAKSIRPVIEHKLAELKKYHGLSLARYIGLIKMRIQVYMTVLCVNVKRMIRLIYSCVSPPKIYLRRVQT